MVVIKLFQWVTLFIREVLKLSTLAIERLQIKIFKNKNLTVYMIGYIKMEGKSTIRN